MSFLEKAFDGVKELLGGDSTSQTEENKPQNEEVKTQSRPATAATEENPEAKVKAPKNRYESFAPERQLSRCKWFVDGASYFYAVSVAIERAQTSIWIMDWWLSPELYLRRPPSQNENYRLDRMLKAAADRGVTVNIMVYKEVTGVLTTGSEHTKKALEALHPTNIAVFRHPDHYPTPSSVASGLVSALKDISFRGKGLSNLGSEGMEAIYGLHDDVVLMFAHHEKLCLVDDKLAFMGGLDMCFGRWDTNQHEIADAHPSNLDDIVWPGQDFNNSRIMDFEDVANCDRNKLDRRQDARMGWSDLSMVLEGDVVEDIQAHFVSRWNWIYDNKYATERGERYNPMTLSVNSHHYADDGKARKSDDPAPAVESPASDILQSEGHAEVQRRFFHGKGSMFGSLRNHFHSSDHDASSHANHSNAGMKVQFLRSASPWSHGVATEHSIENAYISVIRDSEHFVYIENQFFITSTDDQHKHVKNQIGAAIVERIVRAKVEGRKYKIIVLMPAVPAFAGDLHSEDSAGTMAIMEFQYESICRGGSSIIDKLKAAGIARPDEYIQFYNLRNYDRINASAAMANAEDNSGINYESARREHDDVQGAGYDGEGEETGAYRGNAPAADRYQKEANKTSHGDIPDSVVSCYMADGPDITSVPWATGNVNEMDSFVSEELYIHTKLLIADDRIVICGSANLNDRSQLGDHDSEMAVIIEDSNHPIQSSMNGEPYQVYKFAASLRRQIFRKHLGFLPPQNFRKPCEAFMPYGFNDYDWNCDTDDLVRDPLAQSFEELWFNRATTNTQVFQKAFAPVPCDEIRTWQQYEQLYTKLFVTTSEPGANEEDLLPPKYRYGHVVSENFQSVEELKESLATVKGTLVHMPLYFLCEEKELAKKSISVNNLTAKIYT